MYLTDIKSQESKKSGILSPRSSILIIEDDVETLSLLEEFFEFQGYVVSAYSNSLKASKDLIHSTNPYLNEIQVIITDYSMPGMNGLEFLHNTKCLNRDIKTILISAYNSRVTEHLALQEGAFAFFPKPLSLIDLQYKVDHALKLVAS